MQATWNRLANDNRHATPSAVVALAIIATSRETNLIPILCDGTVMDEGVRGWMRGGKSLRPHLVTVCVFKEIENLITKITYAVAVFN